MYNSINELVTVVIPVLNEEEAIDSVLKEVIEEGFHNILVIDGYSTDNTFSIATKNGVRVLYQQGKGKTGAIETAIGHVQTPYMVLMDGDCTYDPRDIESIVPRLGDADLVIGVRIKGRDNIPVFNRFGNWVINLIFNTLMRTSLVDVCSGMYGLRMDFARKLNFETSGFDVEVEIAAQASKSGEIAQVPIHYYKRVGQQKLQPVKHGFQIICRVFKMAFKNIAYGTVPSERISPTRRVNLRE
jgi:dolichol-phosphate mannosyltransferase